MKPFIRLLLISLAFNGALAQEFKADVSYLYGYAPQWDKMVQHYNFSRPFLSTKQPLLMNGYHVSATYLFKKAKSVQHGVQVAYANIRSKAENENFTNKLSLNMVNVGYVIHLEKTLKKNAVYFDVIVSASASGLFRKINGEPFEYDESRSKAFGIGGNIGLKSGYLMTLKNNLRLSPFVAIAYTPYQYAPKTEAVINQTTGLVAKNWTGIVSAQLGFAFHLNRNTIQ